MLGGELVGLFARVGLDGGETWLKFGLGVCLHGQKTILISLMLLLRIV